MALKKHGEIAQTRAEDPSDPYGLYEYTDEQLLEMRGYIDQRLEIRHIGAMDLGYEIMVQLRTLKHLQHKALTEKGVPVNQQAQAANTVSKMLQDLVKSRSKLYDAERIKKIEEFTIEAMKDAPAAAKDHFFVTLERYLATLPTLATLMSEVDE